MTTNNHHTDLQDRNEQDTPRKGTWISVGFVGVFILLTYLLVFGLYMVRV